MIKKAEPVTSIFQKKRADHCNFNFNNVAASVLADNYKFSFAI